MKYTHQDITVIILSGGQGSRMGGRNKGLIELEDQPFVKHVFDSANLSAAKVIISANKDINEYKQICDIVVTDSIYPNKGPLSGVINCLPHVQTKLVMIMPCDTPRIPDNLTSRLLKEFNNHHASIAVVHDGNRQQNLFFLCRRDLLNDIPTYLDQGQSSVYGWMQHHHPLSVDFSDAKEAFSNINAIDQLTLLKNK